MGDLAETIALKPCPFCGAPAEIERDNDHHGEWFNLGCSRHWGKDTDDQCIAGRLFYTEAPESEAEAIAAWNRRAATSPAGDLAERLEDAKQAMSETHSSWESLCHAIMAALGVDYGRMDEFLADEDRDSLRHQSTGVTEISDEMVEQAGRDADFLFGAATTNPGTEWEARLNGAAELLHRFAALRAALSAGGRT